MQSDSRLVLCLILQEEVSTSFAMRRCQSCEYVVFVCKIYSDCIMCSNNSGVNSELWVKQCKRVRLTDVFANISPPVCASTCADFATSEEIIVMTEAFCGGNTTQLTDSRINLIRADFTVCALPANSLRYVDSYTPAN
jgi:hypothetical protein